MNRRYFPPFALDSSDIGGAMTLNRQIPAEIRQKLSEQEATFEK
jgi:hypothetical protein